MNRILYTVEGQNTINIYADHAEIILENRQHDIVGKAIIDLEDIDKCKEYRWYTSQSNSMIYVRNDIGVLHRFLFGLDKNDKTIIIRHIDGDTFNCRRSNLTQVSTKHNKDKSTNEPVVEPTIEVQPNIPCQQSIIKYKDHAEIVLFDKKNNSEVRAMIDLDDVDKCKYFHWTYNSVSIQCKEVGCLHRYLADSPKDMKVIFRNEDRLDCRKANLLCLTNSELYYYNEEKKQQNGTPVSVSMPPAPPTTPVTNNNRKTIMHTDNGYYAFLEHNGKTYDLGRYNSKEEAEQAYINKVHKIYEDLDPLGLFNL
jgi:hypothetical protein